MYNNYFGFQICPLIFTPDPRFFYTNPFIRKPTLIYVRDREKKGLHCHYRRGRTGKSTLLRKLMRNLGTPSMRRLFLIRI